MSAFNDLMHRQGGPWTARVGVDVDGVCLRFAESLREYMRACGVDVSGYEDPQRWEFYLDWGYSLEEFIDWCNRGVNDGWIFARGEAYEGTREALCRLREAGHSIHFVTDRSFGEPGMSALNSYRWFADHGLPYDSVTFSADKTVTDLDFFIDDKVENYDALDLAGVEVYLCDRPWNRNPAHRSFRRVAGLPHFVDVVLSRTHTRTAPCPDDTEGERHLRLVTG